MFRVKVEEREELNYKWIVHTNTNRPTKTVDD